MRMFHKINDIELLKYNKLFKEEDIISITNSEALVDRIDYLLKGDNND